MKNVKISRSVSTIANIDYRMWATLMLTLLLPTLYTTTRILFLGSIPSAWGYNIASQLAWVNIMYEVFHEALLLPLFFLIGKVADRPNQLRNRVITGLIVGLGIHAILGAAISLSAPQLVTLMAQASEIAPATVRFIRLETVAKIPAIAFQLLVIVLVVQDRYRSLIRLLGLQMILMVALDAFLVRAAPSSLSLGVYGIPLSNLISFIILSVFGYRLALSTDSATHEQDPAWTGSLSFRWLVQWGKVGGLSGLESLVRNAAFMLMVLRMVNIIEQPGTFWIANNFIWGWILLPVLSLGTLVKRDAGKNHAKSLQPDAYFWITGIVIIVWLLTIPAWTPFVAQIMGVAHADSVVRVAILSLPFYIAFAFNNVVDSIFYGTGRTDLMLIQSIVVNTVVYGIAFALFRNGLFVPTLDKIAILFGIGILLDSLITFLLYFTLFRKQMPPTYQVTT